MPFYAKSKSNFRVRILSSSGCVGDRKAESSGYYDHNFYDRKDHDRLRHYCGSRHYFENCAGIQKGDVNEVVKRLQGEVRIHE